MESHHYVLEPWAELRRKLGSAPRLLTLDYHTDTSAPFRKALSQCSELEKDQRQKEWIAQVDYQNPASIRLAIERLSNDEHIQAAIASDIISSAFVVAPSAMTTDLACYMQHKISCFEVVEGQEDLVLEDRILEEAVRSFDAILLDAGEDRLLDEPYILDIDLDYLNTSRSVCPTESSFLKKIAQEAVGVTVATEPEYVEHCSKEPGLTSELLLGELRGLLGD